MEKHSFRNLGQIARSYAQTAFPKKFPHQEIRWNYGVFRSDNFRISFDILPRYSDEFYSEDVILWD